MAERLDERGAAAQWAAGVPGGVPGRLQPVRGELGVGDAAAPGAGDGSAVGGDPAVREAQGGADGPGAAVFQLAGCRGVYGVAAATRDSARGGAQPSSADAGQVRAAVGD